jgi:hypothetical protein
MRIFDLKRLRDWLAECGSVYCIHDTADLREQAPNLALCNRPEARSLRLAFARSASEG